MGKFDLNKMVISIKNSVKKHSPEILIGIGITGMITTTVTAVMATPKALKILEEERENREELIKPVDVVKLCWRCYVPSVAIGATSIACIIGASAVHTKRNAALATAYSLSESVFRTYKDKVIETIGEKKEKAVKDAVAKDTVEKHPVVNNEVIITDSSNTLCLESISGRYFKCDIDKLRKAENTLNKTMINDMYVSLNDFYYEIGLPGTKMGDELGWSIDKGLIELDFSSQLAENGDPCLVVGYDIPPMYGYQNLL